MPRAPSCRLWAGPAPCAGRPGSFWAGLGPAQPHGLWPEKKTRWACWEPAQPSVPTSGRAVSTAPEKSCHLPPGALAPSRMLGTPTQQEPHPHPDPSLLLSGEASPCTPGLGKTARSLRGWMGRPSLGQVRGEARLPSRSTASSGLDGTTLRPESMRLWLSTVGCPPRACGQVDGLPRGLLVSLPGGARPWRGAAFGGPC